MKLHFTIEIHDGAPTVEWCGENCKFLGNGFCQLFEVELESHNFNNADMTSDGTIVYEKTKKILGWNRPKQCIKLYSYDDS